VLAALAASVFWGLNKPAEAGEPTPQAIFEAREQLAATVGSVSAPGDSARNAPSIVSAACCRLTERRSCTRNLLVTQT